MCFVIARVSSALDGDHIPLDQKLVDRFGRSPIGWDLAGFPHDEAGRLQSVGLEVVVVDPVVADQRIGQEDNLARVAGIGEDLLIAGHAGVENNLADSFAFSAERLAFIDGSVTQDEVALHFR